MRTLIPPTIRAPFAAYSHGVEIPAGARFVMTLGQLGAAPDDSLADDARA